MGDEDVHSKQWVEGFAPDGKSLERIVKDEDLERMQRQVKEDEVMLSRLYREKKNEVEQNQEKLQEINKEYLARKEELEEFTKKDKVELDSEQKGRIEKVTKDTVDGFLARRETNDENMEVEVDVHFVAEKDTTSESLHLGGEGAGSRDAKFIVSLESKVENLAVQAAKYWGLDANKVFFLDRDERIVPDDMKLREIILPPSKKRSAQSSSSTAMEMWTVKGRNYSFKLVRAETVLEKQDLTSSNGQKWADFTFQEAKLEEELENTRKKYGDAGLAEAHVNMDEIPSLFDLINKGQERKRRKRWDTRCRCLEFVIFMIATLLFYWLIGVDDTFTFYIQLVNSAIRHDFVDLTLQEAANVGAPSFMDVVEPASYERWVRGPLKNTLFGSDTALRRRNTYVLAAFGVSYAGTSQTLSLNFCDSAAGHSNCYDQDLQACGNDRVVRVFNDSRSEGHTPPQCRERFAESMVEAFVQSYDPGNDFTYIVGDANAYFGGSVTTFNMTHREGFDATIDQFLAASATGPARLVNVIMYVPSLRGLVVIQLLAENVLSGSLITHVKQSSTHMDGPTDYVYAIYILVVLLSFTTFLMEVRRILGRPKRWSFEDHRDPCSGWTCIFFLLPVLLMATFVLVATRQSQDIDDLIKPVPESITENGCQLQAGVVEAIYSVMLQDVYILRMKLGTLVFTTLLFFRYLLMYFPQLSFLAAMVLRVLKPLLVTFTFIVGALVSIGSILFATYSTTHYGFKNVQLTMIQTLRLTMGGNEDWFGLYLEAPALFLIVECLAFVCVTLILNNMALAIMVSHKKEKDLHENASFHPFWTAARSKAMASKDPRLFNPATAGEDFSKKKQS